MKTLAELKEIERKFAEERLIKEEADRKLRQVEDERWKREDYPKIVQEILEDIPKKLEEKLSKDKRLPDVYTYSVDANSYKYRQRSSEIVSEVIVKLREQGYNVRREYRHGHDDGVPTEGFGPSDWEYYDIIIKL